MPSSPSEIAAHVTLACLWEALAPKPGNVYRGADFEDVTFADFAASAAVIAAPLSRAGEGVGAAVLRAIEAMRATVATNAYLGTVLLIAPLSAAASRRQRSDEPLAASIGEVLERLTPQDTADVYAAIRLANPGGLGAVAEADVAAAPPPALSLTAAMALAADRDLVARQYVSGFAETFGVAEEIAAGRAAGWPLADSIVRAHVATMARHPDSLIARKCGPEAAAAAASRAARVLEAGGPGTDPYEDALADLDFWLRADGHRRNPGTTADLVAAALFTLLVEGRITLPVRFYG